MPQSIIAALDIGTTGIRAMGFSKQGKVVAAYYEAIDQHYPGPGMVEQDPMRIATVCAKLIRKLVDRFGPEALSCLGIANQRETTILWDKHTGKPVHNAIVWQDQRTAPLCEELIKQGLGPEVRTKTGLVINPYFSATKLKWLLDSVPGVRQAAEAGDLVFGTPDTWILWYLSGGKIHATEPGNASRTMFFNIHDQRFDPDLLETFTIPQSILPQVLDSDALFGFTDTAVVGASIPIRAVLGDQQASLFGQGGSDPAVVKATYGTGIFILQTTGTEVSRTQGLLSTVAWRCGGRVTYALEGSILMGGASLQWLGENLGILDDIESCERIARSLPDNQGVYFVPAFQGLGSPYWSAQARALLVGISRQTGREAVIRAAIESMAYQVRDVIEVMSRNNKPCKLLRVDGGATANEFLMQFQANLLGITVQRPSVIETTAVGVAALAGIAAGLFDQQSTGEIRGEGCVFLPAYNNDLEIRCYEQWKRAVDLCTRWKSD